VRSCPQPTGFDPIKAYAPNDGREETITMTLEELQQEIARRWGSSEYGPAYLARQDPQRDAHHALLHVHKAGGKLAGTLDGLDHVVGEGLPGAVAASVAGPACADEAGRYLADLVICATRVAERWPGGAIDLQKAITERLAAKFPPAADPKCPVCPGGAGKRHKLSCAQGGKQQIALTVERKGG
jgi:hypothetical protein